MNVRIFWVCAMKCMYAQTRPRFILSSEGVFEGNGVWTHVNSKGKIPSTENVPRGGSNPRCCGQRAQALPTELFRPSFVHLKTLKALVHAPTELRPFPVYQVCLSCTCPIPHHVSELTRGLFDCKLLCLLWHWIHCRACDFLFKGKRRAPVLCQNDRYKLKMCNLTVCICMPY